MLTYAPTYTPPVPVYRHRNAVTFLAWSYSAWARKIVRAYR